MKDINIICTDTHVSGKKKKMMQQFHTLEQMFKAFGFRDSVRPVHCTSTSLLLTNTSFMLRFSPGPGVQFDLLLTLQWFYFLELNKGFLTQLRVSGRAASLQCSWGYLWHGSGRWEDLGYSEEKEKNSLRVDSNPWVVTCSNRCVTINFLKPYNYSRHAAFVKS